MNDEQNPDKEQRPEADQKQGFLEELGLKNVPGRIGEAFESAHKEPGLETFSVAAGAVIEHAQRGQERIVKESTAIGQEALAAGEPDIAQRAGGIAQRAKAELSQEAASVAEFAHEAPSGQEREQDKKIMGFFRAIEERSAQTGYQPFDWKKEGFDVSAALDGMEKDAPFVEVAGPTAKGFAQVDLGKLNKKVIVSNILEKHPQVDASGKLVRELPVDLQADARALPFADSTLGAVFCRNLGEVNPRPLENTDAIDAVDIPGKLQLRSQVLKEAGRALKDNGLLVWEGGETEDFVAADHAGFEVEQFHLDLHPNNRPRYNAVMRKLPSPETMPARGPEERDLPRGAQELSASIKTLPEKPSREVPPEHAPDRQPDLTERAEAPFDAATAYDDLRKSLEGALEPALARFYEGLHPDDLKALRGVLSMRSNQGNAGQRPFAALLLSKISSGEAARALETHDRAALDAMTDDFKKEVDALLDSSFGREAVFRTDDAAAAAQRTVAMNTARVKMGRTQAIDAVADYAMKRAAAEAQRQRVEAARPGAASEPAAAETEGPPTAPVAEQPAPVPEQQSGLSQPEAGLREVPRPAPEQEGSQEWLDQKREAAFGQLNSIFKELELAGGQEAVRRWLQETFNPLLEKAGRTPIAAEDLSSLHYMDFVSEPASRVAGQEVRRPVLVFDDGQQYDKLQEALFGSTDGSEGYIMRWESDNEMLTQTGLIFGQPYRSAVDHEVLHTIDPHVVERQGVDHLLLAEGFTLYQEAVVDDLEGAYASIEPGPDRPWRLLAIRLNSYADSLSAYDANNTLTREQFGDMVQRTVETLRSMTERDGQVATQRRIAQCRTLDELFAL